MSWISILNPGQIWSSGSTYSWIPLSSLDNGLGLYVWLPICNVYNFTEQSKFGIFLIAILCKDISRLTDAIQVQRESTLKQEIYGQISTGYKIYSTNQINKEGSAIALKRSLEEELKNLEDNEAPTRILAKKRSQLSRVQYLCPSS